MPDEAGTTMAAQLGRHAEAIDRIGRDVEKLREKAQETGNRLVNIDHLAEELKDLKREQGDLRSEMRAEIRRLEGQNAARHEELARSLATLATAVQTRQAQEQGAAWAAKIGWSVLMAAAAGFGWALSKASLWFGTAAHLPPR